MSAPPPPSTPPQRSAAESRRARAEGEEQVEEEARDHNDHNHGYDDVDTDVDEDLASTTSDLGGASLARRLTNTEQDAIHHPGDVRINVKGAFIVDNNNKDEGNGSSSSGDDTAADLSIITTTTTSSSKIIRDSLAAGEDYQHDRNDIRLPNHTATVSHIAVDIGGSLAKLVYFSSEPGDVELGGRLNFCKFETERVDACIAFMRRLKEEYMRRNNHGNGNGHQQELCVMATGGGAFKYYDRIREALGVEVMREDEMECLIIGLDFFITEIPREVFTYSDLNPMAFVQPRERTYPYLLVNMGSGVSMIKVSGPREFQRVGGTSLGGGTLWGLLSLLTGARSFDEMLGMAERGDNTNVDMLVGDIYGTGYGKIGLKPTTIASTFGKVYRTKRQAEREAEDHGGLSNGDHFEHLHSPKVYTPSARPPPQLPSSTSSAQQNPGMTNANDDYPGTSSHDYFPASDSTFDPTSTTSTTSTSHADRTPPAFRPEDISRSLLYAISNNIGQISFLHAEKHGCDQIYFGGSFIGGHWQTMATLSYAIKFWSKGGKQALFLRHEGYLGAVGAFLKRQPLGWGRRGSFEGGAARTASGSGGAGGGGIAGILEKMGIKKGDYDP